jgi:hypothetical protein
VRHCELLRSSYRSTLSAFLDREQRHRSPKIIKQMTSTINAASGGLLADSTMSASEMDSEDQCSTPTSSGK